MSEVAPNNSGEGASLAAVVCPNGLGHYLRVMGVLSALQDRMPQVDLTILAQDWQIQEGNSPAAKKVWESGARAVTGLMEPGVAMEKDPAVYDDERLLNWVDRVAEVPEVHASHVVVSDNLGGILDPRPDAALMANFVWPDQLGDAYGVVSGPVQRFVRHERAILAEHKPPMICNGAIASPSLTQGNLVIPVDVGWMLQSPERPPQKRDGENKVAVFGGGTALATVTLKEAAVRLIESRRLDVWVQGKLYGELTGDQQAESNIIPRGFAQYHSYAAVVGRPGAGTLTACVEAGTPLLAAHEAGNSEMEFNGSRVEGLGIGVHLGSDVSDVANQVLEVTQGSAATRIRNNLNAQPREGIAQAAQWFAGQLVTAQARR